VFLDEIKAYPLASWSSGFLASWLPGPLASWLPGNNQMKRNPPRRPGAGIFVHNSYMKVT